MSFMYTSRLKSIILASKDKFYILKLIYINANYFIINGWKQSEIVASYNNTFYDTLGFLKDNFIAFYFD